MVYDRLETTKFVKGKVNLLLVFLSHSSKILDRIWLSFPALYQAKFNRNRSFISNCITCLLLIRSPRRLPRFRC